MSKSYNFMVYHSGRATVLVWLWIVLLVMSPVTVIFSQTTGQVQALRWNAAGTIDETWFSLGENELYGLDDSGGFTGIPFSTFASAAQGELAESALQSDDIDVTILGYHASLASIAALTTEENQGLYTTGEDVYATYTLTAAGRALAGMSGTANAIPYFSSTNTVGEITSTAGGRSLLGNAGTANTFPYYSATNTVSLAAITSQGRALLDDTSATEMRNTLGLGTTDHPTFAYGTFNSAVTAPNVFLGTPHDYINHQMWVRSTPDTGVGGAYYWVMIPQAVEGYPDAVQFPVMGGQSRYVAVTQNSSGLVDLTNSVTGNLPLTNLAQGSALSVMGRSINSTGDLSFMTASSDHQVMRRNGSFIGFGAINLSSSNAVTGQLANSALADMVQGTLKGRATGTGTGAPADLTATQARTILNVEDGADVTDTENVLSALAASDAEVDVNGQRIVNTDTPVEATDAANKAYVDAAVLPTGAVVPYAGTTAPSGYLLCYGQEISRTTYADLFAVIGTTYGAGDGSTTFKVPDLRGRVPAGKDDMGGSAAGRLTNTGTGNPDVDGSTLGAAGGVDRHQLTVGQMPSHSHSLNNANNRFGTGSTHTQPNTGSNGGFAHVSVNSSGGDEAHPNLQPSIILNFIIKI